jgi:uncharacterized membrane protein
VNFISRSFLWMGFFACMTTALGLASQAQSSSDSKARVANEAQTTFTFTSFDPPGSTYTQAWAINNQGTVVGDYADSNSVFSGFKRYKSGQISRPIRIAGKNVYMDGINDSGVLSGYYSTGAGQGYPPPNPITTFTYYGGTDSDFTVGPLTQINALNNNGDLVGIYQQDSTTYAGFLHDKADGSTAMFSVPGNEFTFAYGMNNSDTVVGLYRSTVLATTQRAFRRRADGTLTTFAAFGSDYTAATTLNDCGTIVGAFADTSGVFHGFYGKLNNFKQIDFPGSTFTIITGINNHGEMVGGYNSSDGAFHGFIATPAVPSCSP